MSEKRYVFETGTKRNIRADTYILRLRVTALGIVMKTVDIPLESDGTTSGERIAVALRNLADQVDAIEAES